MPLIHLHPDPPTESSLASAKLSLEENRKHIAELTDKITRAEEVLAQLVAESKCQIQEMLQEKSQLERQVSLTQAYVSPIRRLPNELLRQIFLYNFEDYPCCAWVLAAVCTLWRKMALATPRIWSKVRLLTRQTASADTVRLWLERSGNTIPLDIEIFIRVGKHSSDTLPRPTRSPSPPSWTITNYPPPPGTYMMTHNATIPILPPSTSIIVAPPPPTHYPWSPQPSHAELSSTPVTRTTHWGHIAIFYLVEQMHRWERFVFRYDKHFASIEALRTITGDAPLLTEFEVSCAEPSFPSEWPWLPSASPKSVVSLPSLKVVTLQNARFRWCSPMLQSNLTSLTLRALPTSHLPLDRILGIISANPNLEKLSLNFTAALPAVLPLTPQSMPELVDLSIGGHYSMSQIVDCLSVPNIDRLVLDIDARDPIEDIVTNFLMRSNKPPLTHLSIAYGTTNTSPFFYGAGGFSISWGLLSDLFNLRVLHVGGTPLEPLLSALGPPDDDSPPPPPVPPHPQGSEWMCPNLVELCVKHCSSHNEGAAKLVQMVDARNPGAGQGAPSGSNGIAPVRLKKLEIHDSAPLGHDVIKWLKGRVEDVHCSEPSHDRDGLR